jgi:hypothetical protein
LDVLGIKGCMIAADALNCQNWMFWELRAA